MSFIEKKTADPWDTWMVNELAEKADQIFIAEMGEVQGIWKWSGISGKIEYECPDSVQYYEILSINSNKTKRSKLY